MYLPATGRPDGLGVSFSPPISPFSPGAVPGQRSRILTGSAAGRLDKARAEARVKMEARRIKRIRWSSIQMFGDDPVGQHWPGSFLSNVVGDHINKQIGIF